MRPIASLHTWASLVRARGRSRYLSLYLVLMLLPGGALLALVLLLHQRNRRS